jgi:hypothetical protein
VCCNTTEEHRDRMSEDIVGICYAEESQGLVNVHYLLISSLTETKMNKEDAY